MRFGPPIVVVSGLPRSGTSMAMRMLDAAGVPLVTDGVRTADESNPNGYFEYERVKELDKGLDKTWLRSERGKAVKIISFLLRDLPETNDYRVIFMHRPMDEIIASQDAMLRARGEPVGAAGAALAASYQKHLDEVRHLLERRPCFAVLDVGYRDTIDQPAEQAARMAVFLGRPLNIPAMAAAVDQALYRHRT